MQISLTDIIQQANAVSKLIGEQTTQITDVLSQSAAVVGQDKELLARAAEDAQIVAGAKAAAELRTQESRLRIGNDFGTNRAAQNEVYSALSAAERAAWERQTAAKARVDQKLGVSFLENPVAYIMGQLTVDQDIQQHNSANQERQAILQRIQDLNAATSSSAQVQAMFAQTVTAEAADASVRLAAVPMQRAMFEADLKSLQYNLEGIRVARDAPIKQLEMMFQIKSAQNADEGLAIQRRSAARQDMLAQLSIDRERRLAQKEAKDEAEKVQQDSQIVGYINAGRALRGLAPLSDLKGKEALQLLRTNKDHPIAKEFYFDFSKGQEQSLMPEGAAFARSGAEMIALQQSGLVFNTTPEQKVVLDRLNDAMAVVRAQNKSKPLDPKDTQGAMERLNKAVADVFAADQTNVRLGDAKNPYSLPTLNILAQAVPSIQQNPAYAKSLKARVEAGEDLSDPKRIFTALAEDMRAGKITYQEAIAASEIFTRGVAINNEAKAFRRFGVPEATGFNVVVDKLPFVPGGTEQVNFMRPDQLGRALLSAAVQTRPFSFSSGNAGTGLYDPRQGPPSPYASPEDWKTYRQFQQSQGKQ